MRLSKIHAPLLLVTLLATLSGCSDGEGRSGRDAFTPDYDAPAPGTYSGQVMNGYLRNAVVWIDLDNDRVQDADEPSTVTGSGGRFLFTKEALRCGDKTDIEDTTEAAQQESPEEAAGDCITRPKAYPLGVKVYAPSEKGEESAAVDEFTKTTVSDSYYLWAPPIPNHVNRLVTPFTTLIKAERDLDTFTGLTEAYPLYEPPTEAQLAAELDRYHDRVRDKLGVTANLLGDYIRSNNPRLHAYARGIVHGMQAYIRENGGRLDDLVITGDEAFKDTLTAILEDEGTNTKLAASKISAVTGLAAADVEEILKSDDFTNNAERVAEMVGMLNPIQSKLDALGRALVNQGHWILGAINEAAGSNPTASTFNSLKLAEVVPEIFVLENDPRMLYRKKFYVNPSSYLARGARLVDGLEVLAAEDRPHIARAALTQVQSYLYDLDAQIAQIDVYGDLYEWRRDLLVSYPIQLEALFPPGEWRAQRLDSGSLGNPTTRITIENTVVSGVRSAAINVDMAASEGLDADPEESWQQKRQIHEMPESETVKGLLKLNGHSQSWLRSQSRRLFGSVDEVSEEVYPAVGTALDNVVGAVAEGLVPTAQDTSVEVSRTGTFDAGRLGLISRGVYPQRWRELAEKTVHYHFGDPSAGETLARVDITVGATNYSRDELTRMAVDFELDGAGSGASMFQSYCVNYNYDEQGDLKHEIYVRRSNGACQDKLPVLTVEYEYRHLSELLAR